MDIMIGIIYKKRLFTWINSQDEKLSRYYAIKEQVQLKKLSSVLMKEPKKWKTVEPSLTSLRLMVLEISHSKVRNLSKINIAIL